MTDLRIRLFLGIAGVTEVDARWLSDPPNPLCVLSAPLDSPAPSYLPRRDAVVTWHAASFGPHSWQLPPVTQAAEDHSLSTAVFAQALLEGKVLPAFKGEESFMQDAIAVRPASAGMNMWRLQIVKSIRMWHMLAAHCAELYKSRHSQLTALALLWQETMLVLLADEQHLDDEHMLIHKVGAHM